MAHHDQSPDAAGTMGPMARCRRGGAGPYGARVDTCPECGNGDVRVRVAAGVPIHECGLCGARFGDRTAIEALDDADEAVSRRIPAAVWPLVRALERLPGIFVRDAAAGDAAQSTLPFVVLAIAAADALLQLENLAKSLLLGAGALRRHWILEVEYQRNLTFVLKPRHGGGSVTPDQVRDAQTDLDTLRRHLERDVRLGWWRHAGGDAVG